jgi:hypothetical protein
VKREISKAMSASLIEASEFWMFDRVLREGDGKRQLVLPGTEIASLTGYLVDRLVDLVDRCPRRI